MVRIMCVVSYDGTNYAGYQIQNNGITIQEKIEQALKALHKGKEVQVIASGRTDARVHAVGQTFHFDTTLTIPEKNWKMALNTRLPKDIFIESVHHVVDDFHARYDAIVKEYRYFVLNRKDPDIFVRNHRTHVRDYLDIHAMQEACTYIEGEHDFSAFCSAKTDIKGSKVRTVYHASCQKDGDQVVFVFKGSGFLYNMVRILVGTLIEIGKGERLPSFIIDTINSKDRNKAGKTAPPQGLFLWEVTYR
ncbi:tRNA pseudouridine synthase A 1 [Paraliobacillus quinghaiensis]|uniref:tRNA pseudouridine synthase A n=1 Tax=Paraliobacillus quinghaiensis TaxID=470815 RepID=A0A917WWE2_9BACI|nr:tRNA pseudouridine(38-40) synthase TruA [Paraliobacillus quinghaiensis]GGM34699.1 tRNA pseudouridine synthase A 1 [Paraliobacillus quinghaiensis]